MPLNGLLPYWGQNQQPQNALPLPQPPAPTGATPTSPLQAIFARYPRLAQFLNPAPQPGQIQANFQGNWQGARQPGNAPGGVAAAPPLVSSPPIQAPAPTPAAPPVASPPVGGPSFAAPGGQGLIPSILGAIQPGANNGIASGVMGNIPNQPVQGMIPSGIGGGGFGR